MSILLSLIKIQPCIWVSRSGLADLQRATLQHNNKSDKGTQNNKYNANVPFIHKSGMTLLL